MAVISSCATSNKDGTRYVDGYYIANLNYSLDKVYKATVEAIQTGETYDVSGSPYYLKVNKKGQGKAVLEAYSDSSSSDFVTVEITEISKDESRISIKYGREGNSIRSSALIEIIDGNIRYS
jgi:hypothetical protein